MSTRVFIVGTDTAVGKTAVTAALLRTAAERGMTVAPFKPAQSGDDQPSDTARLLRAARLPPADLEAACPLRYPEPLAPGLAEAAHSFTRPDHPADPSVITRVREALDAWEARLDPSLTLIEGAGGLHVPMPGATWQPTWIAALAGHTLVVGRAGLGTINHTLATIAGLRLAGRPPLGFVLNHTTAQADPSTTDNAAVITTASGVPHLGTLPHGPEPALAPALLDALLARLHPSP